MATFETQVEGLTGLTIDTGTNPTQTELTQFLKDGVIDVTTKCIQAKPHHKDLFMNVTALQVAQGANIDAADVISVVRADGVTAGNFRSCRKVTTNLQYLVTDTESLHFASKFNPVFIMNADGTIHVFPAPSDNSGLDSYKVYYVNNTPVDGSATSLTFADSTLGYFPADKVYLVVIYASIKSLDNALATSSITAFVEPAAFVLPASLADADISFSEVGSFPTFIKPSFAAPTLVSIGSLNLPVPPAVPANPSISSPGVASTTISILGSAPTYTQPKVGGEDEELTATMDADTAGYGTDADFLNFSKWFSTVGDLIEDEEDTELAASQLQKISTYIQAYGQAMQNQLHKFNDANVEYQASIQKAIQQGTLDSQEAQKESDLTFQASIQDYTLELQKYQAEAGIYQAQVNAEVQRWTNEEWTKNFQKYSTEYTQLLAEYGQNIQSETARVGNESNDYQQKVQKALQEYQAETGYDTGKYSADLQAETQRFTQDLGKQNAVYQAEIQKKSSEYQWMTARQQSLKQEYSQAFATMAPPAQPQQQGRRG